MAIKQRTTQYKKLNLAKFYVHRVQWHSIHTAAGGTRRCRRRQPTANEIKSIENPIIWLYRSHYQLVQFVESNPTDWNRVAELNEKYWITNRCVSVVGCGVQRFYSGEPV